MYAARICWVQFYNLFHQYRFFSVCSLQNKEKGFLLVTFIWYNDQNKY